MDPDQTARKDVLMWLLNPIPLMCHLPISYLRKSGITVMSEKTVKLISSLAEIYYPRYSKAEFDKTFCNIGNRPLDLGLWAYI
jgi:hypothetical protein